MILLMTTAPPIKGPWIHARPLPPIGLAYVAAALEKNGFQVEIIDNYLLEKTAEELKLEIKKKAPELVGITCSSVTHKQCLETAKTVKEVLPSCKVVVGGWHPSYMPDTMLQHEEIDYVVVGEGERAIVELINHITESRANQANIAISGIAYKHEGKIIKTAPKFISDLDEVPFPARHLLPMDLYDRSIEYLSVKPADIMSVIRGCPFNCAFCESKKLWGQSCRSFSPRRVVAEIDHLVTKFGSKGIYFINDNFTIRKKETSEICRLIRENKIDIEWVCDTRVDLISRELLREMKGAGCKTIWFGVESGSLPILKKLNIGVTLEQIARAFKLCKEEGLQTASSFLMGIPGETVNDLKATFKLARKLDPDWCRFNIFVAVPGSSLYDEVMQKGLYDRLEDFSAYVKTEEFNYESLLKIQKQFLTTFNKSPKRIFGKIKRGGLWATLKKASLYVAR